ncbi:cytochrome p450 [Seiridium cupressi]
MDEQILVWVESLQRSSSQVIDIGQKIQFLTVDIITRLCLGDAVGCIRNNRDMYGLLQTVETGNLVVQYLSVFTELNTLLFSLSRIPVLRKALFPNVTNSQGVGRLMGLVHEVAKKRPLLHDGDDDLVSALLERGMPAEQIDSEVIVALAGGSDTTSTSVQSTLLCIATNPRVYATLRSEIHTALREGKISRPIRDAEAKQLVYLQAVVLEGLRKHPPLSQLRERVVPAGGDSLGGYHLPAGTLVGLNGWGTQLKTEIYGDDAALFRPERWLTGDEERLRKMHACHSLIFGHGATKCLGVAMAMMEIPKVVFELLRNFDVSVADPHRPWTSRCYGIFHQKGFRVVLGPVDEEVEPPAYEPAAQALIV